MSYPNAAKGIRKIYIAEILHILAAAFGIGILLLIAINKIDLTADGKALQAALESAGMAVPFVIYAVATVLLILVSFFLNIAGILQASKDEESFKRALWIELLGLALAIAVGFLQSGSRLVADWLHIASTLCTMMVTLLVLEGIGRLAVSLGKPEISDMGRRSRAYLLGAFILSAVTELLIALRVVDSYAISACQAATYLLDIGAYVLYLRVLAKARVMQ